MTRLPRAVALALAVPAVLGAGAGCLRGSADLVDGANARVIVTGLAPGDTVRVEIDDGSEPREASAPGEDPLVVYLTLRPGDFSGVVTMQHEGGARCQPISLHIEDEADVDVAAADAKTAPPCDPDAGAPDAGADDAGQEDDAGAPDAGGDAGPGDDGGIDLPDAGLDLPDAGLDPLPVLVTLTEEVDVLSCLVEPCQIITTLEAQGTIRYTALAAATVTRTAPEADVAAAEAAALSAEADALFAHADPSCPQPRPPGLALDGVVLKRAFRASPDAPVTAQQVDVTGCDQGVAPQLRLRLQFLRQLTGLPL